MFAVAAIGGAVTAGIAILGDKPKATITGRLAGIRGLSFTAGSQSDGGISPVCGCKEPQPDAWRGITFASREVNIVHHGAPWTQWVISAAEPEPVELSGDAIVHARLVRIAPGRFDPRRLVDGSLLRQGRVVSDKRLSADGFSLATRNGLRVALLGKIPVGAWIPFPGSRVTLGPTRSAFFGEARPTRIVDRYSRRIGFWPDGDGNSRPKEPQVYPLADFLGPNLVLWSRDRRAQLLGQPVGSAQRPGTITAILIPHTTFSARIGVVGIAEQEVRIAAAEAEDTSGIFDDVFEPVVRSGRIALTITRPVDADRYAQIRRQVARRPLTEALLELDVNEEPGVDQTRLEEQRLPPLPRAVGFNVFGPLERIDFRGVHGHLTVGDKPVDLSGSANLTLEEISGLRNQDGSQLVSAPLSTAGESAGLQFSAVGRVVINGLAQALEPPLIKTIATVAAAAVGFLAALVALAVGGLAIIDRWRHRGRGGGAKA